MEKQPIAKRSSVRSSLQEAFIQAWDAATMLGNFKTPQLRYKRAKAFTQNALANLELAGLEMLPRAKKEDKPEPEAKSNAE
jgi:hypothetical protein